VKTFYANSKIGKHEYNSIIRAKNKSSAEAIVRNELNAFIAGLKGEKVEKDIYVFVFDLSRMDCSCEYWDKRMLLQKNKGGTYTCTDRQTNVTVRMPRLLFGNLGVKAVALYDNTSDRDVEVSKTLAVAYYRNKKRKQLFT